MAGESPGQDGRKPIMAGNWKMHHSHLEAIQVVQKLSYRLSSEDYERCEVVVCPSFTSLRSVQTVIEADNLPIGLGAQNVFWEDKGAYTGEVSPLMLAKLAVSYVIVGHSERREIFGETDEMVNRKVKAVFGHGMTPIMCVGETLEEREAGETAAKVSRQVQAGLEGVEAKQVGAMVIAYEPIWAIGTGRNATPEDANETIGTIRSMVAGLSGEAAGASIRIQYGGSVKPGNIAAIMAQPEIDGALVGGASLEADDFAQIVRWA
ncbi:MAG TPA: triose-phosphate isomerase [Acidimicrobiia bacterium]|jgi:triosephosphate isomerase|nr:triose-phosphate isomerase [Acidimicrobiia bacterium]